MNPLEHMQHADNWGFLNHECLPSNVDGFAFHYAERDGQFIFFEVKRGEGFGPGQEEALLKLSCLPEIDIVIVHSLPDKPDKKNSRRVIPIAFQTMRDGVLSPMYATSEKEFAERYHNWFKQRPRIRLKKMIRRYTQQF